MKSPWKILIVSEPTKDGVFIVIRDLIRFLHTHHPEITVDFAYSSQRSCQELSKLVDEVRAHGGETADLHVGNFPEFTDFSAWFTIRKMVAPRKYALVHAHSSKAGGLVRLAALFTRGFPPVLYTPHAYFGMPQRGNVKEFVFNTIETLLGHIGTTCLTSEDEFAFAKNVLHIPAERLTVIHSGVNTKIYSPVHEIEKRMWRQALKLPETGKILTTVGRVSYQKCYEPLYRALARELPNSDWFFVHAGAGACQLRETLPPAAAEHCFCFEFLENIPDLLHASDGFILTSRYEGLSRSMLEAICCGLVVIVPDALGFQLLRELNFPAVIWLPKPTDTREFEEKIQDALHLWKERNFSELLQLQITLAREFFTDSVQDAKLVELYEKLIPA